MTFTRASALSVAVISLLSTRAALADDRITVQPVLFFPKDVGIASKAELAKYDHLFQQHLVLAQKKYQALLGTDPFPVESGTLHVLGAQTVSGYEKHFDKAYSLILEEVFRAANDNRDDSRASYVILFVRPGFGAAPKGVGVFGGGRPFNGAPGSGGGFTIIEASWLATGFKFQSTLVHELGHTFGLAHCDCLKYRCCTTKEDPKCENRSLMSYHTLNQTKGLQLAPGIFNPEEYYDLSLNKLAFPRFKYDPAKHNPQGKKLKVEQCFLPTMDNSIGGHLPGAAARFTAIWIKPGQPGEAHHGLNGAQYQAKVTALKQQGYKPRMVNGYVHHGEVRFSAIWEKAAAAWMAHHDLDSKAYQLKFDQYAKQGYRLEWVSGYPAGGAPRFAAIWTKKPGPAEDAFHELDAAQYQARFNKAVAKGLRPVVVNAYVAGGKVHYAGLFSKSGETFEAHHDLTAAAYQKKFDQLGKQGYALDFVSGVDAGAGPHFSAVWVKTSNQVFFAQHGMSAATYQKQFDAEAQHGLSLKMVSGYDGR